MQHPHLLSIGEVARRLGVSHSTLRRWHADGTLPASLVSGGGHRYYSASDLERHSLGLARIAREWASAPTAETPATDFYCPSKDHFKARLDRMEQELDERPPVLRDLGRLAVALTGEIGNNAFDHNIGNWPDVRGAFFAYDLKKHLVVIADRGQGILATLGRVRPELESDRDALRVAFTEVVTGRAPEKRGNGLKFVRSVVASFPIEVEFQSGKAVVRLHPKDRELRVLDAVSALRGCFAVIQF